MSFIQQGLQGLLLDGESGSPKKSAEASTAARERGNKLYRSTTHTKKIYLDTLSCYSESAALAEDGSEELALAYSNRSALLFRLHKYQECLVDIKMAHQITKSDELRVKLLTRKMKCMKLRNDKSNSIGSGNVEAVESLAVGNRSPTIPCAYDCVTLAHNEKFGTHVVATKNIEPGQVIVIEKALAQFPSRDKTYLVCSHCLAFACNGLPCKSCVVVIYCSEKCRKEAWAQYHDAECVVLPYTKYTIFEVLKFDLGIEDSLLLA
ncbi:SET and MYND domain-containing protein 4-like, partial [Copidosoma floridanum]